jgi:hypothetical protein
MPGLSLITAAIIDRNMVYLVQRQRAQRAMVLDDFLAHVTPLGWELVGNLCKRHRPVIVI